MKKRAFQKVNFFAKSREKKSRFCKQLFNITFGYISDIYTQDQVQISSIDNDTNLKENQVDAANTQNKLESETRPDEGNSSLN